ncbi:MAG: hypothetical protein HFJ18_03005 [Clostridia bacterium]|nr:hypothetical protein [Clostridia bacterium]
MKENEQASLSIRKIALITIMLIFMLGVGVRATTASLNTVKIVLSDNYQIEVITTKKVVSEILEENHIIVLPTENVFPSLEAEISGENATITITSLENPTELTTLAEESEKVSIEQLLSNYSPITEKIVTKNEEIPYETVDEDGKKIDTNNTSKNYKVQKKGKVGKTQSVYKIRYQNEIEIEKIEISKKIISQPVKEVLKESTEVSTRNSNSYRSNNLSAKNLASLVEGIEPQVRTLNTSAYTASTCGKDPSSPGYGITSSGARATAWYTVAAGSAYPVGTVIYIPYFANKPNGGWFVVQDRGGAIKNNKLDVYMDTYRECEIFGRRNLECYIYVR